MATLPFADSSRHWWFIRCLPLLGIACASPAKSETVFVQPSIDTLVSAVHQTNVPNTSSFGGETHEWVTQISPGLKVNARGANSLILGDVKLDIYNYSKNTRPNQAVPTGTLRGQTQSHDTGLGLEAAWSARQEPDQFSGNSDSGLVQKGYSTTEWRIAPFFEKKLSESTQAKARVDQSWVHSTQIGTGTLQRPDSRVLSATASLGTLAKPLGYELGLTHQTTHVEGQSDPVLTQSLARFKGIYALSPELEGGFIIGRESDKVLLDAFNDRVYGWHLQWRPQERTQLNLQSEHRFFGQSWQVDARHRMPWLALSSTFSRVATTYASSLGTVTQSSTMRDLFDAMLTTQIPDKADRSKAVDDLITQKKLSTSLNGIRDIYNLTAQLRQEASGRLVVMGRRNTLAFSAGRIDATPLTDSLATLATASSIREYFFYSELNHQLTPTSRLIGGLRWNRLHNSTVGQPSLFTRSFSWSTALSTDLSRQTSATVGLRRQISHSTATGASDENAAFAGLGYRF